MRTDIGYKMGKIEELRKKLGITTPFYSASEATQLMKALNNVPSDKRQFTDSDERQSTETQNQEPKLKEDLDHSIINFLLSFGFNHIDPLKFEELVLEVFKKFGFTGNLTPVTGDDGIDIFLYDVKRLKGVVQCKRYAENQNISVKDVREFLGSMIHVNAEFGYFIATTSFSEQAKEFAKGKKFYLIDGLMLKQIALHAIAIELGLYSEDTGTEILTLLVGGSVSYY